jgi:hypothetical protein
MQGKDGIRVPPDGIILALWLWSFSGHILTMAILRDGPLQH